MISLRGRGKGLTFAVAIRDNGGAEVVKTRKLDKNT